jgi:hypothetical protein
MPLVLKDRVKETSATTGTGTLTLGGAAIGFQSFAVIGDGNTTYYAIFDRTSQDWEVGVGTYTSSGTTLTRDTVLESSNSGSLVNFGAGLKDVFCTYPAEKAVTLDDVQTLTNKTINLANNTLIATSAQLAASLTDETGTGALVFATSPTLVTPALGTPSSGNLANCTFPTLNQNTTGTAAVSTAATVTTSTTASAFKVPFANTTASTTGNYGLLQDSEATFTYNPSTNTLVVGTVSAALSGNATTATTLQTARTIGGVSFNGSANINLPGVNTAGNQNTTGTAANVTGTVAAANGGTGRTSLTANNVILGNGTSAVNFVAPSTSGNVLTSNGTTWTSAAAPSPTIASTAEAQAGTDNTKFITPLRMRDGFNASGSAPVYACRAWVNFNGTGTVAIRASGNVSSITDNGTGVYTVNFTTAMPDVNYCAVATGQRSTTGTAAIGIGDTPTTSGIQFRCATSSSGNLRGVDVVDYEIVSVAVFR